MIKKSNSATHSISFSVVVTAAWHTFSRINARPLLHKCAHNNAFPCYNLISQKLKSKWHDRTVYGGYYHEMRKIIHAHRASAFAHLTKDWARTLGRGALSKYLRPSPPQAIQILWSYPKWGLQMRWNIFSFG